jgi:serine/threonine-protein kinase
VTGPSTGQQFGAYRLHGLIGRGGMGIVYRAEHEHLGRTVALKLLTPELAASEGFRGRFMRESRLAASLDHPSIVTVYDAGEVNGTLYIAMRFVDGTDLAEVLRGAGALPPDRALGLVGQVAAALDAAHERGLVHRDVKPANVLIDGARAYLTDFGLTKPTAAATQITTAGQFLGTVAYVAPEQIQGVDVDGRADVYALGCVLFECITGQRPFVRDTDVAILYAHMNEPPPRPSAVRPDVPPALDNVVLRALAKAPEQRWATCAAMVAAARAALAERPPQETAALAPPSLATAPLPQPTVEATPTVHPPSLATAHLPPSVQAPSPYGPPPMGPPPPPGGQRGGFPTAAIIALLALLVVAGAAAAFVLTRSDDESAPAGATPGPAAASSGIAVGDSPHGVAVAGGYLWVANSGDGTVTRVAPDGSDRREIEVGTTPLGIAGNAEEVWVTNFGGDTVTRIDVGSAEEIGELETEDGPWGVVLGSGRGFVTNELSGTISEWYFPSGEPRRAPWASGTAPRGIAVVPPGPWTANSGEDTVVRHEHGIETARASVGDEPVGVAASAGAVWVANSGSDTVSRIDIANPDAPPETIDVGDEPYAVAVGEGYVWVAHRGDNTVWRLDSAGGAPVGEPIPVGGQPAGIAIGEGSAWVTLGDRDEVERVEP